MSGSVRSRPRWPLALPLAVILWGGGAAQEPPVPPAGGSETESRETFLRVCAKCHTAERITAQPRTRAQWEEVMVTMRASRGAVFSDQEFETVLEYLTRAHGPTSAPAGTAAAAPGAKPAAAGRGPRAHVGAADRHRVEDAAAARGRKIYAAECVTCHGATARGTDAGANLVRSPLMLRDRYGSAIGPLLRNGHPMQTGRASASLTDAEIADLSHYIWQRINDTLKGSPPYQPGNVLTGNAAAGRAYFEGEGRCTTCHSATGDLAGYAERFNPVEIQQRFVFPEANAGRGKGAAPRKPVTATVTLPGGETVSGVLVLLDDFNVAIRDSAGQYRSWARTPGMTITRTDPYAAHAQLLDRLTDRAMHDVVAYLATLK